MKDIIKERINNIDDWLIMNSGSYPFIVGMGTTNWTADVVRHDGIQLLSICGMRYEEDGVKSIFFASTDEYRQGAKKLIDNKYLQTMFEEYEENEASYDKFIQKVNEVGPEYLDGRYDEFKKLYRDFWYSSFVPDGFLIYGDHIVSDMKEKYPDNHTEIDTLTQPFGQTFNARFEVMLIEAAIEAKKKGLSNKNELMSDPNIKEMIDQIQKEFYWLKNNYRIVDPLPVDYFAEEVEDRLGRSVEDLNTELKEHSSATKEHQEKVSEIENSYVFDEDDFYQLFWIGKVAWWIDRRKERNLIGNYYLGEYSKLFAKKLNTYPLNILWMLPWEVESVLAGKSELEDYPIEARRKGSIHAIDIDGNWVFLTGKEADELWSQISPEVETDTDEISGNIAWKGKVKGTVRIVFDPRNPGEFNKGDILVTGMTRPDYLGLMKEAGAFVTDEGGVTCHAAIVAREMNKPCIIGTKIATKVLKDGMEVEVDADNGVVKIININ